MSGAFRSLKAYNYRVWSAGGLISNIGTWMQRVAQDWLVLAVLTHHSATAVGIVTGLQFGPQVLLLPFTGHAADHFDRRKLLFVTQAGLLLLALGLGLLTLFHKVELWHVYGFALAMGCITAFDSPARQTIVSDLVAEGSLPNAVALNSASFNAGRLVGPAAAGALIAMVDVGWVFLINALSFVAVLASIALLRVHELTPRQRPPRGTLLEGFRYVWRRPDLKAALVMLFLVGSFGLNFPIFISTMSVSVFHAGAGEYGVLTSTMAIGSVIGALGAARRGRPRMSFLITGAALFGAFCALAAMMPNYWLFGLALLVVGLCAQTFTTSTNSLIQLTTEPAMRGRVMAILLAIALGGQPIAAPIVGWVADAFGPRWALGIGASSGLLAAASALWFMARQDRLSLVINGGRPRLVVRDI